MAAEGKDFKLERSYPHQFPGHVSGTVSASHKPLSPANVGGTNKSGCVCCCALARSCVSLKKRRFVADGYDLDLAYITDRIIAMGFPSHGVESCYRNPYEDERTFLDERHAGKYKVFNLCGEAERQYDPALFYGRACTYGWLDHEACPFNLLFEACGDAAAFLAQDPQHVVALHCKAGKGRTGLLICCLLLHLGVCASPLDAMTFYATRRTFNGKGLTIPSQKRYVCYYNLQLQAIRRQFAVDAVSAVPAAQEKSVSVASSSALEQDPNAAAAAAPEAAPVLPEDSEELQPASSTPPVTQQHATGGGHDVPDPPTQSQDQTGQDKHASGGSPVSPADTASPGEGDASAAGGGSSTDAAQEASLPDDASAIGSSVVAAGSTAAALPAIGPWQQSDNSTVAPDASTKLLSICIRGRIMAYSHIGVTVYQRTSGTLRRQLVLRCPPQPYGGCGSPGAQSLQALAMPATLFQGMQVAQSDINASIGDAQLTLAAPSTPAGDVRPEADLTVWQGDGVMGDDGVLLCSTDYFVVVTGHSSVDAAGTKVASAWVHATFLPSCSAQEGTPFTGMFSLPKRALDKVFKDKKHEIVSSHFQVHLLYAKQQHE